MSKRIVIKNLPSKFPIVSTAVAYLLLDKFNAPEWLWGSLCVFYGIIWIVIIVDRVTCESVDLFADDTKDKVHKKTFKEKLEELARKYPK